MMATLTPPITVQAAGSTVQPLARKNVPTRTPKARHATANPPAKKAAVTETVVGEGFGWEAAETAQVNMPNAMRVQPINSVGVQRKMPPSRPHTPPTTSMAIQTHSSGPRASRTDGGVNWYAPTAATRIATSCVTEQVRIAPRSHVGYAARGTTFTAGVRSPASATARSRSGARCGRRRRDPSRPGRRASPPSSGRRTARPHRWSSRAP